MDVSQNSGSQMTFALRFRAGTTPVDLSEQLGAWSFPTMGKPMEPQILYKKNIGTSGDGIYNDIL